MFEFFKTQNFNKKSPTHGLQQPGMFAPVYKSALRNPYFGGVCFEAGLPRNVMDFELLVLAGEL